MLTVTVFLAVISMLSYRRSGIRAIFLTSIALIVLAAGTFAVVLAVIFTDLLNDVWTDTAAILAWMALALVLVLGLYGGRRGGRAA